MAKQGFEGAKFARPLILGHRGMGSGGGENTLAAFSGALEAGADGVELDVRRTADGALTLSHDPVIPGLGPVAELTLSQLPAEVPLLEAALDLLSGRLVNIEVKNLPHEPGWDAQEMTVRAVAALLGERGRRDHVIVSAFTAATLTVLRDVDPEVPSGFLTTSSYDQFRALETVVGAGWSALHPHHEAVDASLVEAAHAAGVKLNVWTVNGAERVAALAELGVDAVITDGVAEAVASVAGREDPPPG